MFWHITTSYDRSDATFEILFMLLIAFLLGYLLARLLHSKSSSKNLVYGAPTMAAHSKKDNLKVIEWVGPKIEELLYAGGIMSFADVVHADIEGLQEVLDAAGPKYQMHNPKTWPDQADLAAKGRWKELKEYQDILSGGRD